MGLLLDLHVVFWYVTLFLFGASVGSLINVCVYRLPLEKSILWPSSRCGNCLQPIRARDNIPVLSYLILRGRCRACKAGFSARYCLVELVSGLAWPALFYLEVHANWHELPAFNGYLPNALAREVVPWLGLKFFLPHAALLSFLLVASLCDIDGQVIPLSVTLPGTLVGLACSTLLPWPWPNDPTLAAPLANQANWAALNLQGKVPLGLTPWPVWGPLPEVLPAGSWQLGLATGLAGALAGSVMLRVVKFLFERGLGKEALGLGDADLMMMAGAFLGWQPVVIAFFAGAFAALFLAIPTAVARGENALPFGPGLAIGVVITWLGWRWIGPSVQHLFFDEVLLAAAAVMMTVGMFVLSLLFRLRRLPGTGPATGEESARG